MPTSKGLQLPKAKMEAIANARKILEDKAAEKRVRAKMRYYLQQEGKWEAYMKKPMEVRSQYIEFWMGNQLESDSKIAIVLICVVSCAPAFPFVCLLCVVAFRADAFVSSCFCVIHSSLYLFVISRRSNGLASTR